MQVQHTGIIVREPVATNASVAISSRFPGQFCMPSIERDYRCIFRYRSRWAGLRALLQTRR